MSNLLLTEVENVALLGDEAGTLAAFNNTFMPFNDQATIHQLFEEQVAQTPDKIAVRFKDERLTYEELNSRANALALRLRMLGVKPDSLVGLMCERSLEMIIGMYGILKAGGAYIPISPYDPANRINLILDDSGVSIMLVQQALKEGINFSGAVIELGEFKNDTTGFENLPIVNKSTDLIYVIYTSGSTGIPKGVMVEHRAVVNRLKWMQNAYSLGKNDVILQKTPFNFDVSVWEFFWWAIEGASMCFLAPHDEKSPLAIAQTIEQRKVTIMHFVPSMLGVFTDYIYDVNVADKLQSLRLVFASGEKLSTKHVSNFNKVFNTDGSKRLVNLYGPTEATVDVTHYDCSAGEQDGKIPIGRPIDNIQLYVVDGTRKLRPIGEAGELVIAGVGVARGYLNRKELTEEKFINNPFGSGKMYRTGDLCRWLPDGNIEYINRIDHQVKIRGLRIEIGEIEAVLVKHESLKECIVTTRQYSDSVTVILAYYVSETPLDQKTLKAFAASYLPEYMVPGKFIRIDRIPLTSNGKADRKALHDPFAS